MNTYAKTPADRPSSVLTVGRHCSAPAVLVALCLLATTSILPPALLAGTVSICCDDTVAATIDPAIESDLFVFCFDVSEGEIVTITVVEDPAAPSGFWPEWRLLDGAGTPAADCGLFTTFAHDDCGPLPASGNPYKVQVQDWLSESTGDYRVHLQRVTAAAACDQVPMSCDLSYAAPVETLVDNDLFSFFVSEGEIVAITVIDDPAAPSPFWAEWRLLDGAGNPASDCGFFTTFAHDDCGPLSAAGNPYRVQVKDWLSESSGDYWTHLQRLTATAACDQAISCEVASDATIAYPADNDLLRFCVTEGALLRVTIVADPAAPPGFWPEWRLLDGAGNPAADCGLFTTFDQDDCGPLSATDNPHRLQIEDWLDVETGDYGVFLAPLSGSCLACPEIFSDGFESGSTSAWSAVAGGE